MKKTYMAPQTEQLRMKTEQICATSDLKVFGTEPDEKAIKENDFAESAADLLPLW